MVTGITVLKYTSSKIMNFLTYQSLILIFFFFLLLSLKITRYYKENETESLDLPINAIILAEWLKELSAICQEHTIS